MRFTERIIEEQRKNRLQQERNTDKQQDEQQEDEMGLAYMPRPRMGFLNENKGIFDNTDTTSINTAPSIFERTAIFHVGDRRDDEER